MSKSYTLSSTLGHLQERTASLNLSSVLVSRDSLTSTNWMQETAQRYLSDPLTISPIPPFPTDVLSWDVLLQIRAPIALRSVPNYASATSQPEIVSDLIQNWSRETFLERVTGVLNIQLTYLNPLALVSKIREDGTMKHRLVVDCTASGLNASLGEPPKFTLPSFWDALSALSANAVMFKVDLKNAFLQMRVNEACRPLLGIRCPSTQEVYRFTRVPFGINLGPVLCQAVTYSVSLEANRRINLLSGTQQNPRTYIVVYEDDFLGYGETEDSSQRNLSILLEVLAEAHLMVSSEKTIPPSKKLEFVGVTIDLSSPDSMNISLAPSKLVATRGTLEKWLVHQSPRGSCVPFSEFRSLVGKLGWFSQIVPQGRLFLSSSWALIAQHTQSVHVPSQISLSDTCIRDLLWWLQLLRNSPFQRRLYRHPQGGLSTIPPRIPILASFDASLSGYGGTILGHTVSGQWPETMNTRSSGVINRLEMRAALTVIRSEVHNLRDQVVLLSGDSATAVAYLNLKGRRWAAHSHLVDLAAEMKDLEVRYKFTVIAIHTPTKINAIADTLSRGGQFQAMVKCLKSDLYLALDHQFGSFTADWSLVPDYVLDNLSTNQTLLRSQTLKLFAIVDSADRALIFRRLAASVQKAKVFLILDSHLVTSDLLGEFTTLVVFPTRTALFVLRDPVSHQFGSDVGVEQNHLGFTFLQLQ